MTSTSIHTRRGFTLMELMIVMLLMAMIAAISAPRLLPLLTLTEHENEARHLVGYGRAAMAHAAMAHTSLRVRIDLDAQEYWTEKMPQLIPEREEVDDPYARDDDPNDLIPDDPSELARASQKIVRGFDDDNDEDDGYGNDEDRDKVLDAQRKEMGDSFGAMANNSLYARAMRVKHEDFDYVDDDSLFSRDEEDEDDLTEEEMTKRKVDDPLLQAHRVIESVWIDTVIIGDEEFSKGIVDIELTPLGLETEVSIVLFNEDDDLLMVYWDPMTGNAWYKREAMSL